MKLKIGNAVNQEKVIEEYPFPVHTRFLKPSNRALGMQFLYILIPFDKKYLAIFVTVNNFLTDLSLILSMGPN